MNELNLYNLDLLSSEKQEEMLHEMFAESILPELPSPLELIDTCYQIAKESPGKTAICEYVHNEAPSCIIGTALHKQYGWSVDQLRTLGRTNIQMLYEFYINRYGNFRVQFEEDDPRRNNKDQDIILEVLSSIQEDQDKGWPWARVMAGSITNLEEYWGEDPGFVDKVLLGIFNYESFSGRHPLREHMFLYKNFPT